MLIVLTVQEVFLPPPFIKQHYNLLGFLHIYIAAGVQQA